MSSKLRSIRAGHRSVISRLLKKFEDIRGDGSESVDTQELNKIVNNLLKKQETLQKLNEDILENLEEGEVEAEIVDSDEYAYTLDDKITEIQKLILVNTSQLNTNAKDFVSTKESESASSGPSHSAPAQPVHDRPSYTQPEVNTQQNTCNSNFREPETQFSRSYTRVNEYNKLPKLNLPTFDGNIMQWQSFWDSYETSVHENPTLSNVQRFNYLKSLLYDEALKTVTGFALTHANYEKAISLLQERYGQTHVIRQKYMQALVDIPAPKYTSASMKNFYDEIEIHIRGLESLGQSEDTYGAFLVPIIMNKLPGEIRRNLARQYKSTDLQLSELRSGIFDELNIMDAGKTLEQLENPTATATFLTNTKPRNRTGTDYSYVSRWNRNANASMSKPKPQCAYCKESHPSVNCTKVSDYNARMTIVKRDRLCFNCLGHHSLSACKSTKTCNKCNKRHHTSICKDNHRTNDSNKITGDVNVGTIQHNAKESDTVLHSQSPARVLLKTAVNPVSAGQDIFDANILFDEGAQRSFVTQELADKLKLKPTGTESVNLSGFGDNVNSTKVRHLKTGLIYLMTREGKLPIRVLIVPEIATPMRTYVRQAAKFSYLSGIKLAHPVTADENFEISVLIGADYYWSIVKNRIIRGEGPTAVQSKIGYLLSGTLHTHNSDIDGYHRTSMMNVMIARKSDEYDLEKFWKIESIATEKTETATVDEHREMQRTYEDNQISYHDNRYFVTLPWKEDHPTLPTNKVIAQRRTENVVKRLSREPKLLGKYGEIMAEQEKRGFIEKVNTTNLTDETSKIHYIPHHAVRKDSTTTPIRVVFDCSCRATPESPSLNDCLMTTPPNLNELVGILLRFRLHQFAVTTDIEKAFLNVGLETQDRDATRFFWFSRYANRPINSTSNLPI